VFKGHLKRWGVGFKKELGGWMSIVYGFKKSGVSVVKSEKHDIKKSGVSVVKSEKHDISELENRVGLTS